MQEAAKVCESFDIPYEVTVVSAHRTPERLREYASSAEVRGLKVIIAGAGGAAHLPGMAAAFSPLPVIGVPIETKSLKGIDSLLSIAQMPYGIPVATVAINGAKNAGLLAAEMLSIGDEALRLKVRTHKREMEREVLEKAENLSQMGYEAYLKG